jgi:hypothetical protein
MAGHTPWAEIKHKAYIGATLSDADRACELAAEISAAAAQHDTNRRRYTDAIVKAVAWCGGDPGRTGALVDALARPESSVRPGA